MAGKFLVWRTPKIGKKSHCLLVQDKEDSGEIDSILGNEKKCESKMSKKIETEEEHSGLAEPQNAARTEQSVSKNPDSSIDLEPDKNLERFYCCKKEKTLGAAM